MSELGQLLDPIADKLLLFAMLVPIFWITRHPTILVDYRIPWWGSLPVWVALLLVGREVLITAFRFFAKRRGVVIPAQRGRQAQGRKLSTYLDWISITAIWSLTGCPAVSVPIGFSRDGLPIGIQILAHPRREADLFHLAAWIEREIALSRLPIDPRSSTQTRQRAMAL